MACVVCSMELSASLSMPSRSRSFSEYVKLSSYPVCLSLSHKLVAVVCEALSFSRVLLQRDDLGIYPAHPHSFPRES